jgi:ribonuclease D
MAEPQPIIIATQAALDDLAERLAVEPLIAIDTESNSLYAYRERVCLIQVSTRDQDWVIDPLALADLSPLGPLLADVRIEKVFHAAEYDLMCLKRDYGFTFENLFDTQVAARILGIKAVGLGNLLEAHFGVRADKRFQRANWAERPIPARQLAYAAQDTHFLPALRDIMLAALEAGDYLVEAGEAFDLLAETQPANHSFDPEGYWHFNAARTLSRRQMAILRELYVWREELASARDLPPFRIAGDDALVAITLKEPAHPRDLHGIRGIGEGLIRQHGPAIIEAVRRGQHAPPPRRPERGNRTDPNTLARYNALRDWRKQRAAARGVESDVIIPRDALWALARTAPQTPDALIEIPGLGPWKRAHYGAELLRVLESVEPAAAISSEDDTADR